MLDYVAHIIGAAFFVNALPHLIQGVSGKPFQSPFAKPPGVGLSSPVINVFWGGLNFIVGFLLVFKVGNLALDNHLDIALTFAGGWLTAFALARYFGRFHGGGEGR